MTTDRTTKEQATFNSAVAYDPLDFTGKTIWVTGAGRGIGREVVRQFLMRGATVIGFDVRFEHDDRNSRFAYSCILLDVSDEKSVASEVSSLIRNNEGPDVLINAAGILKMGALEHTSLEDFKKCFDVNAGGVFLMLKNTLEYFKEKKSGCIVSVSSNAAKVPRINMAAYCASKAALSALNHTAALELAPFGVRCNLVCPGSTDTPMQRLLWTSEEAEANTIQGFPEQFKLGIPLGKIAQPSEIAQTILFFASSMSSHITMQDVVVDGGATLNV
ncbi:2,3-dihydro-2,3-dihydroxybenzoate dehydrogenase [Marinomonas balearica]|uniref:2,3-dihydro-2,3-dihydroxybenzoate dehydrogenase n=1 Tax=Marinomonas balearica TaxID=491947 RepID=A0A4R6MBC9_9GAMM|nr:2,3-dihydro-2,3-dihydroxybenzoate dehydrogenase [Marinomonas balearica]TDO98907.1 2,3-dihydro-2,3-dihydroxybenzoate dehydrogenase [Marinomonas balearica]